MKTILALLTLLVIVLTEPRGQAQEQVPSEGKAVQDTIVIKNVLKAVRSHVLSVTKDRRKPLVIREGKKSRKFIVMDFPGSVWKGKSVYTAQIDVDEYDHKIPRFLYIDVRVTKGKYKVTKIRIGPNHFREDTKHPGPTGQGNNDRSS